MKLPAGLLNAATRFDRMTLRERALVAGALLAVLVVLCDSLLMQPLTKRQNEITARMVQVEERMQAAAAALSDGPDATSLAEQKEQSLQATLSSVNHQLAAASAGLIAPERMASMLHEVLAQQHGLTLIDLHNEPVRSLVPSAPAVEGATAPPPQGPFAHPVVLVVEGSYLDVLTYLRALEDMPYRLYWNRLELNTVRYPANRVRIELSTLSMDEQWLGV
jgi:MSHA biogenesis protein MshJ